MPAFADHFSRGADGYAAYRPTYPAALFSWLAEASPGRARAWDCGTGNGQAAGALAPYFDVVLATDPSEAQVGNGGRYDRVRFAVMTAESPALADGGMDLITVAQALHWFDRPRFYSEARRVLKPGGLLAVWRYGLATVDPAVDAIIERFYSGTVGPYWPPERAIVEAGYGSIEFPFAELAVPAFSMEARWSLAQLTGFLGTWSAVTRFRAAQGTDPIPFLMEELAAVWGDPDGPRPVRWPLEVRAGRLMSDEPGS